MKRTARSHKAALYGIYGDDPYLAQQRRFSVIKCRLVLFPEHYNKTEWVKSIAKIYMRELRNGRADGKKIRGFLSPYPAEPASSYNPNSKKWRKRHGDEA